MSQVTSKLRLDVGAGDTPKGNVNCDLYLAKTPEMGQGRRIDPKQCPNFLRCDTYNLPFRDNSFEEVFSSHLMEHLDRPTKALMEMLRVSSYKVTFIVPHRMRRGFGHILYPKFCREHHRNVFNIRNIDLWLRKNRLVSDISVRRQSLPHPFFPIFQIPWDVQVTVYKPY